MKTGAIAGIIIAAVIVLGIAGYVLWGNSGNSSNSVPSETLNPEGVKNVNIANFAFSPETLNVKVGDTVVWTNNDGAAHTVTSDSGGELDSNLLSKGEKYSHTFSSAGEFDYHCTPHPSMKGKVIVS